MGLCIHYQGKIKKPDTLPQLIEEVQDISQVLGWECEIFDRNLPAESFGRETYSNRIYGICIIIPDCEPVFISFLSNGMMCSPLSLEHFGHSADKDSREYLYYLSVKTQYAGTEIHKKLVHLFKHLSKKYFTDFELTDEGYYWETGDEQLLCERFKLYNELVKGFGDLMTYKSLEPGESYEDYFARLLKELKDSRRKNKDL